MDNNRILWVDYAKYIAISIVMLDHLIGFENEETYSLFNIIALPAFVFLSGFFSKYNSQSTIRDFYNRSIKRIVFPYFILNIVSIIFYLCFSKYYETDAHTLPDLLYGTIVANADVLYHNIPIWFLPMLFCVELMFFIVRKFSMIAQIGLSIVISISGYFLIDVFSCNLPWGVSPACLLFIFYFLGYLYKSYGIPTKGKWLAVVSSCAVLGLCYNYLGVVNIAHIIISNYGLTLIASLAGIIFMCSATQLLDKVYFAPCLEIGKKTLWIMGLHLILYRLEKGTLIFLGINKEDINTAVGAIVLAFISQVVFYIIFITLNKITKVYAKR